MEASLTCAVCLSLFEEPVTLPLCSHNFCRDCVLECLASAEAARLQQQRGQGQARLSRGGPGPGGGGGAGGARVSCPLCRKLCPLPRGGAASLPVNTTLAEVVKLYRSGTAKAGEAEPGPGLLSPLPLGGTCQKHPSRLVQLYCRMCRQAGCGQCVSEEHQGIFHSVNLIDTVYQEEKLTFFSSLKKMRIINEKLMNEISSQPKDMDMVLNTDAEIIAREFGEIVKTLEMKKQQLLEDVENQRSKKEKEFQIWKKMKETHKKTIENFLKDCEKLVHECDPQRFLEVACGLNTRMKTQLDLMNIASSYEKPLDYTQKKLDIKPVVNEILALKLMPVTVGIVKDLPSGGNESSTKNTLFKNNIKEWQDQKNIPNTFLPVAGQEEALADGSRISTRLMSISEMSAFQNMSHEELRYKYYMERQKLTDESKTHTLPANKKYKFVTAEALKDRSSGTPFVSSPTKANNTDKVKMGTLQRADGFERSFSGTSNHSIPSTSTNFSETNGDLKLLHERGSQEVTTPALSENIKDLVIKEKLPMQASAVIVSSEMDTNSSAPSTLKPAAAVAVPSSNSEFLDVSAERLSASPFAFSACNNSLPRFIKDTTTFSFKKKDRKYVFPQFYLGKCDRVDKTDNQDESKFRKHGPVIKTTVGDASASPKVDSSESEKPDFSFPFGNSERDCFAGLGVSNSFKVLPLSSFFSQSEKPSDKNTSSPMREKTLSAKEAAEYGTQEPSVPREQKANATESITTIACGISETSAAAGVNDVSESPLLLSNCVFSFKNNPLQLPSPVFSFGSTVRNPSDSLTSSVFLSGNGTEKTEKEKMKSVDETPLNLGKPVSSERVEPASRHSHPKREGSFFPRNSPKKTESAEMLADSNSCSSVVLPVKYETASSTQLATATKQETKVKDEGSEAVAANNCRCSRREDEPEPGLFENAACSVPGTGTDLSLGGSVLTVNEAGGMPSDSDSDTEELSQTSTSTDTSSASEYFSVAEDKISTRRKSET
ncbi:uncharacterized protein LOC104361827 [Tyto alba]|uniref:uncharacterized protein LOC104361827 n=1 Tax=Tyto alba TaxID=56313 RepID=UPI001C6829AD|nr:uncharacterized protein LOC104361827 [Tyto alba]